MGAGDGTLAFTADLDTTNHALAQSESRDNMIEVQMTSLDLALALASPTMLKIDVEGFEFPVLQGAKETLSKKCLHSIIVELNGSGANVGIGYWAGDTRKFESKAQAYAKGRLKLQGTSDRLIFIHWSGLWHARRIDRLVYGLLGLCGLAHRGMRVTKLFFPHKRLWLYYRNLRP